MEWNLIYCIIDSIFDNNNQILYNLVTHKKKLKNKIKNKLLIVLIITYIFMPLLIIYNLFYSITKYGEKFYNNPGRISSRQWSLKSKWKLRYYNELKHEIKNRLSISTKYANLYCNQFNNQIYNSIINFILLILSTIFIYFLFLSFYNEHLLLKLNIIDNKPILWFLGFIVPIISILKSITIQRQPQKTSNENLVNLIKYLPNNFLENYYKKENLKYFKNLFEYQIYTFCKEYFSVILIPFYIIRLLKDIDKTIDELEGNIIYDNVLGYIDKNSCFKTIDENSENNKKISFYEFRKRYPEWGANIQLFNLGENIDIEFSKIIEHDSLMESNISII